MIKGIGGGGVPGQKNFFDLFRSKFYVLSPPFYRIEKFSFVWPKMADFMGTVGAILRLNLHIFMEFGQ